MKLLSEMYPNTNMQGIQKLLFDSAARYGANGVHCSCFS